jgi:peroxiredoxin Q/BCP
MAKLVEVGASAPDATLPDQDGTRHTLSDLWKQGPLVLYFYPKDETPGCTAEACAFRDQYTAFTDAGVRVVGVSSDSPASHRRFIDKHRLPFTLLSDEGGGLRSRLGVPRTLGIIDGRTTFIIDRAGTIRGVYNAQLNATRHVREALDVVRSLNG